MITIRRRLHRGRSLWADSAHRRVRHASLEHDLDADVVVVGTGISGALVAHALQRAGREVVMLDRRAPVRGSTLASTALLQFEIDVPLHRLARRIGWPRAQRAYARSVQAVRDLAALVRRERIQCQWEPRESLYLAGDAYGARAMLVEADARARHGIPGMFVTAADLRTRYGIERTGAILSTGSAVAEPARLTTGLLRQVVARGGRIFTDADVIDVDGDAAGVEVRTANGPRVTARQIVLCTGYELPRRMPTAIHRARSTWAIASRPRATMPAWLDRTVVWEGSDPYLYLRSTPDGRIIAGGHDEADSSAHTAVKRLVRKQRMIEDDVHALLPDVDFRVAYAWGGVFGESRDGLPLIDRLPEVPSAWVVAGFGGNGITFSMIASQVVATALGGARDPDASLFAIR